MKKAVVNLKLNEWPLFSIPMGSIIVQCVGDVQFHIHFFVEIGDIVSPIIFFLRIAKQNILNVLNDYFCNIFLIYKIYFLYTNMQYISYIQNILNILNDYFCNIFLLVTVISNYR